MKKSGLKNSVARSPWLAWLAWEAHFAISWIWLVPMIGVGSALYLLSRSSNPPSAYPTLLCTLLEFAFPLLGSFLAVPLLSREWEKGTLVELALHKPLFRVLLLRLALCVGYLAVLTIIATVVSLFMAHNVPVGYSALQWVAAVLLISLAPTLLLTGLTLFLTHLFCSALSGYLLALGYWLLNVTVEVIPRLQVLHPYLLFSWTYPPTSGAFNWLGSKLLLCGVGLVMNLLQIPLLAQEARLSSNKWE